MHRHTVADKSHLVRCGSRCTGSCSRRVCITRAALIDLDLNIFPVEHLTELHVDTVRKISGIFHIRAKLHRFFLADLLEHQHTVWISQGDAGRVIEIIAKKDRLVDNLPLKPDHRDFLCHKLRVSHVHAHEIALLV